jgi:hypothetical protein
MSINYRLGHYHKIDREGHGNNHVVVGETDEKEIQKANKYDFRANGGILCLMIGFILQLISNYLNE